MTRSVLFAAGLAAASLAASPALADEPAGRAGELRETLADPRTQVAVTTMLTALSEAVLDMPVEPVVRALRTVDADAAGDVAPDARVRDLAGRDAQRLPGTIGRGVPRAMGAAAQMAGAIDAMLPQIEAMGDRLRGALPRD